MRLLLTALLLFAGCAASGSTDGDLVRFDGTVVYVDLEGGFYGIEAVTGERLLPLNLAEGFQRDGLAVTVHGRFEEAMTIQQWGRPFQIESIEER